MTQQMIKSPCKQLCSLDPETRTCVGCGRRSHEIAGWLQLSPEEKLHVIAELPARLEAQKAVRMARNAERRGGRSRRLKRSAAEGAD